MARAASESLTRLCELLAGTLGLAAAAWRDTRYSCAGSPSSSAGAGVRSYDSGSSAHTVMHLTDGFIQSDLMSKSNGSNWFLSARLMKSNMINAKSCTSYAANISGRAATNDYFDRRLFHWLFSFCNLVKMLSYAYSNKYITVISFRKSYYVITITIQFMQIYIYLAHKIISLNHHVISNMNK